MADKVVVKAQTREARGKNDARRLRKDGKLPVIVYGGDDENASVIVELSDLAAILRSDSGQNTVFSLDVEGVGVGDVMFHDRQIDPIKGRLIHADLRRIKRGEKIEVTVSINLVGEPETMAAGGVLTQQLREVKIFCTPGRIPESIDVDVTKLEMNQSIHISDLKVEEGVEIHGDMDALVASFVFVKEADLEPDTEAGGEPQVVGEENANSGDGESGNE